MEALVVPGMIAGMLALFGIIWFVSAQREKKRRQDLHAVAEKLGYEFEPGGGHGVPRALANLHLFNQGRSKEVRNALSRQANEVIVQVFDYRYVTGPGKNKRTHKQTVLYLHWDDLALPEFALRPEHIFHKIGGVFGYQDIDFPTHPQFSKQFLLRGSHESAIRETFGHVVLDFFERHPGISAEGSGADLIVYKASRLESPDGIGGFVQMGMDLLQCFPRR